MIQMHTSNTPIYNHNQVLAAMPNVRTTLSYNSTSICNSITINERSILPFSITTAIAMLGDRFSFLCFFFQLHYNLLGLLLQSITDQNVIGLWTSALLCAIYWFIDFRYCQWVCLWGRWFIFCNFSSPFPSQYSCLLPDFPLHYNSDV